PLEQIVGEELDVTGERRGLDAGRGPGGSGSEGLQRSLVGWRRRRRRGGAGGGKEEQSSQRAVDGHGARPEHRAGLGGEDCRQRAPARTRRLRGPKAGRAGRPVTASPSRNWKRAMVVAGP